MSYYSDNLIERSVTIEYKDRFQWITVAIEGPRRDENKLKFTVNNVSTNIYISNFKFFDNVSVYAGFPRARSNCKQGPPANVLIKDIMIFPGAQ